MCCFFSGRFFNFLFHCLPIVILQIAFQWIGMGNQELLQYFESYHPMKARHSYGPHGHRGMSVLIFEASARGYLEAERLHKHFAEQRTDRNAWNHPRRTLFYSGGNRLLYGFLAVKEDLDVFNQHSQGLSLFLSLLLCSLFHSYCGFLLQQFLLDLSITHYN